MLRECEELLRVREVLQRDVVQAALTRSSHDHQPRSRAAGFELKAPLNQCEPVTKNRRCTGVEPRKIAFGLAVHQLEY